MEGPHPTVPSVKMFDTRASNISNYIINLNLNLVEKLEIVIFSENLSMFC